MAIGSSFLNNFYNSSYSSYTQLFNKSSSEGLTDIVKKYAYFKANYKDIKSSLKDVDKEIAAEKKNVKSKKNDVKVDTKVNTDKQVDNKVDKTETSKTDKTKDSDLKTYNKTKISATELKSSLVKLSDDSLYEKDKDGKINTDEIVNAVKDFVSSYNDLKEIAAESPSDTVVKKAYYMVNTTKSFSSSLSKIGITINKDNTLKIDEDKLKNADVRNIKTVFNGNYSYGKQISTRASEIAKAPGVNTQTYKLEKNQSLESYLANLDKTSLVDFLA